MAKVELARHLIAFFPHLDGKEIEVNAATAAEVVDALEEMAPGFAFYICHETGELRRHVNLFIEKETVRDRRKLTDKVGPDTTVYIMQALSGG